MNNGINNISSNGADINNIYPLLGSPSSVPTILDKSGPRLLLDICPGATAAYSLRKLSSNYNGPVIRVRRGGTTEEKDFNANDIDSGYLAKWIGTGNNTYPSVSWAASDYRNGVIFGVVTYPSQVVGQNDPFGGTGASAVSWTSGASARFGLSVDGPGTIPAVSLPVTFSFWARVDSGTVDISTNLRSSLVPDISAKTHTITTSWTRFSHTSTRTASAGTNGWYFNNPASTVTIYFYGFQFEIGTEPTELIETTNESKGTGLVSIWYDQSGNGYDLTASSLFTQPMVGIGNNLLTRNNKPYLDFFQSRWLSVPYASFTVSNSTILTVGNRESTVSGRGYFYITGGDTDGLINSLSILGWHGAGNSIYNPPIGPTVRYLWSGVLNEKFSSIYESSKLVSSNNNPKRIVRGSRIVVSNGRFLGRPINAKIEEIIYYANGIQNIREAESNLSLYYNFTLSPQYEEPNYSDSDVVSYIRNVEATDGQNLEQGVRDAYNNFIVGCKEDGIWESIKSSCILIGARTLNGALTPLAGNRPTSFSFVSGDYDRKTGLVGNGTNKYLNTNRANNADPQDNNHNAIYVSTLGSSLALSTIAAAGASGSNHMSLVDFRSRNSLAVEQPMQTGFNGHSRNSSSTVNHRVGGTTTNYANVSQTPSTDNLALLRSGSSYGTHRISFYSIGEFLDLDLLDVRISTLVSSIGDAI